MAAPNVLTTSMSSPPHRRPTTCYGPAERLQKAYHISKWCLQRFAAISWQASTPINIASLIEHLAPHPDRNFVNALISGLQDGFHTGVRNAPSSTFIGRNLLSARSQPQTVSELIDLKYAKGIYSARLSSHPLLTSAVVLSVSAEKKYSAKKRLIVDLSSPRNDPVTSSINELIDKEEFSLSYVKLDDAIASILRLGKGSWLCKTDIVDAFKLIPIHPSLWHLYGIQWQGRFYFFVRLPFGSRSSPKIFDQLSTAISWIAEKVYGIDTIFHLLDDFLTVDPPSFDANRTMALLTLIFRRLAIPIAPHKTVGPTTCLEYLGIELDTIKMQARLPQEKLDRILDLVASFLNCKSCTKRQLLSLLGHLTFACRVVVPGRTFISRLIELSKATQKLDFHITISSESRLDLTMWHHFLASWNGISMFLDTSTTAASDMELYTDASGIGHGGYFIGHWFQERWDSNLRLDSDPALSIAFQELYPIVIAALLWGHLWARKRILFHCDNSATVHIINKGRSKSPIIMKLMRRLVLLAATHHFMFHAEHIPGS
ncbi:uncharacterized protein [Ptychodera flava]|uniref:uncharacterized protein n=1 Tax=Ptychodera flava TaxID=63121 RepID=UPI003969E2F1